MYWVSMESFTAILQCWFFIYINNLHFYWSWDLNTALLYPGLVVIPEFVPL